MCHLEKIKESIFIRNYKALRPSSVWEHMCPPGVFDSCWEKEKSERTDTGPPDLNKELLWKLFLLVFPQLHIWLQLCTLLYFGQYKESVSLIHTVDCRGGWECCGGCVYLFTKSPGGESESRAPKIDPTTQTLCLCLCVSVFLQSQWGG